MLLSKEPGDHQPIRAPGKEWEQTTGQHRRLLERQLLLLLLLHEKEARPAGQGARRKGQIVSFPTKHLLDRAFQSPRPRKPDCMTFLRRPKASPLKRTEGQSALMWKAGEEGKPHTLHMPVKASPGRRQVKALLDLQDSVKRHWAGRQPQCRQGP